MSENEKQLIKDMYKFIELLHVKVKILDDLKERVLIKDPDYFTTEQIARWEESNRNIAIFELENLKNQIDSL
jgi:hypothetical protein